MTYRIFMAVLNMSIAAAFLLVLVLVGRLAMKRYGTAGFRYLLWLPFLFRLLIPYSLPSVFSVYNLFHQRLARPGGALLSMVYFDPSSPQEQILSTGQTLAEKQWIQASCVVWAVGAAVMMTVFCIQYLRLWWALKVAYLAQDIPITELCNQVGLRHAPVVMYTDAVRGPMVFGILRPRVLLPLKMRQETTGKKYILLHEFSHIRWWDHGILLLGCLALALHWFNPLVWLARSIMAQDIEHACDQRVLQKIGQNEQLEYAQTLVDWASQSRFGVASYAAFGEKDVVHRIKSVLSWKRLPRWMEAILGCGIVGIFLCAATNPVLPSDSYLPTSSPLVSKQQHEKFRQSAYQLKQALESGDGMMIAQQASMDPNYFAPLYENLNQLSLHVDSMQLYCNSNTSAELYMQVTVKEGAGLYATGSGTLVAHMNQTEYREEPLVDCLMPQQKYEGVQLADTSSEAARLALRMCENVKQQEFEAKTLSPITVAKVCMASAIEDKGEYSPFSAERMQQLAKEYFALDSFSCDDPAVYDADSNTYFYTPASGQYMLVTEMQQEGGDMRVVVESYEDPLCLYPLQKLECKLIQSK